MAPWTFFSNHGLVLFCVTKEPRSTLREISGCVGITERRVQGIVNDLVDGGYLERHREGNRNRYTVRLAMPLRHELMADHQVQEIFDVLDGARPMTAAPRRQ